MLFMSTRYLCVFILQFSWTVLRSWLRIRIWNRQPLAFGVHHACITESDVREPMVWYTCDSSKCCRRRNSYLCTKFTCTPRKIVLYCLRVCCVRCASDDEARRPAPIHTMTMAPPLFLCRTWKRTIKRFNYEPFPTESQIFFLLVLSLASWLRRGCVWRASYCKLAMVFGLRVLLLFSIVRLGCR